ncbi:NUDIX hydrolase [Actinobaculum massiliense]|nr:NUDIX hydrolase [Actinobaculum massiliense]MDK8566287.1 NUDIX hydrolase [Actinobaculum massiliense]
MSKSAPLPSHFGGRRSWRRAAAAHQAGVRRHSQPVVNETSAGGIVIAVHDGHAYTAVIARRNRGGRLEWCLPKGHLEGTETAEEAAVREVAEETGITGRVLLHLATIDYWFSGTNHRVHKVVHHFLLEALSGYLTVENDPDHEAEKVEWVRLDRVSSRLAYPNERRIVSSARAILAGDA